MWKRDESVKPAAPTAQPVHATPATSAVDPRVRVERDLANIGKSVLVKGELSGSEDLTVEGQVEGRIELRENVLTVGVNGRIRAEVFAKAVIVLGQIHGNVTATDKVDIRDHGSIDGNIISPRVAIAEGAHFRGSVDMQRGAAKAGAEPAPKAQAPSPGPPAEKPTLPLGPKAGA